MSSRMYKPRGSPRASRFSRRQTVNNYRAAGRSAMYRSVRTSNRRIARARNLGLKNARTGGLLEIETKFIDNYLTTTTLPVDNTTMASAEFDPVNFLCLNGVPQGDTMSSRDGSKIAMKSLQVSGAIELPAQTNQTTTDSIPFVYIAVVLDTQTNKAQLNSEDVFTNPSASGATGLSARPLRNMSYTERFKVLKKKVIRIPQPSVSYDGTNMEQMGMSIPFDFFIKLGGLQTKYDNGTTTGYCGTIIDNSLPLLAYASNQAGITNIAYKSRLPNLG